MSIEKLLNARNSLAALQDAQDMIKKAQAEKSKPTPLVATLTGRELYEFGNLDPNDPNLDEKAFFKVVREYFQANIQGKTVTHPFLGEIQVSRTSWQKIKFGVPRNMEKTLAIPAILAALEHGKCSHIETGRKDQKKDFIYMAYIVANIKIDTRIMEIGLSVAIDTLHKRMFYNLAANPTVLKENRNDHKYRGVKAVPGFDSAQIDEFDDGIAIDLNIDVVKVQPVHQFNLQGHSKSVKDEYDSGHSDVVYTTIAIDQVKVDLRKYTALEKQPESQHPIVIQEVDSGFLLIAGYERFRLAKQQQEQQVPAIILSKQHLIDDETLAKAYQKTIIPIEPVIFAKNLFDLSKNESTRLST